MFFVAEIKVTFTFDLKPETATALLEYPHSCSFAWGCFMMNI
jgi:hypothetical protein